MLMFQAVNVKRAEAAASDHTLASSREYFGTKGILSCTPRKPLPYFAFNRLFGKSVCELSTYETPEPTEFFIRLNGGAWRKGRCEVKDAP
jgi:hypothetical protein